jgi:hypothetical protein
MATDPSHLQPDSWTIVDHPDGWDLRYRAPLTPAIPGWPLLFGRIPGSIVGARSALTFVCSFLIVTYGLQFWFEWPNRWGYAIGPLLGLCLEGLRQYCCWEIGLNSEALVSVRESRVFTWSGIYPAACLKSLRLSDRHVRRGRASIVFSGMSVSEVVLVGRPGMSPEAAGQLLEALRARVELDVCQGETRRKPQGIDATDGAVEPTKTILREAPCST